MLGLLCLSVFLTNAFTSSVTGPALMVYREREPVRMPVPRNDFDTITRHTFSYLDPETVLRLVLTTHGIENIVPNAFGTFPNLVHVDLGYNRITKVPYGIFNGLNLTNLQLNGNEISYIEERAFTEMLYLENLDLSGNSLVSFPADYLFTKECAVKILNLGYNLFTVINENHLRGLKNLEILNLGNNQITKIERNTFQYTPNIRYLKLSQNKLSKLIVFSGNALKKLEDLRINNNQLSNLPITALLELTNLTTIRIGGNPWRCGCLDIVQDWIKNSKMHQPCDHIEYFNGIRPSCVASKLDATACHDHDEEIEDYSPMLKLYPQAKCEDVFEWTVFDASW